MPQVEIPVMETQVKTTETGNNQSDPYFEITSLARAHHSRHAFFSQVLEVIAQAFSSSYAALYVETGSNVTQDEWAAEEKHRAFWGGRLQSFLTESMEKPSAKARLLNPRTGKAKAAMLSSPMLDSSGVVIGAMALVVSPVEEESISRKLGYLESMTSLACHTAELLGKGQAGSSAPGSATDTEAFARAGSMRNPVEIAFAITNNLRNQLGCEQIALGLVKGHRVKILSISGMDNVPKRNPGIVPMRAAMEECVDFDGPVVCQSQNANSDNTLESNHRLHHQWRAAARGSAVASIPIHLDDKPFAVLSLRKRGDQSFSQEELEEVRGKVEPFAPVFVLARRASRGLLRHLIDNFSAALLFFFRPGRIKTKFAVLIAAVLLPWILFGKVDYRLAIPCQIAPAQIRHAAMPFDGMLVSSGPVAGDPVKKGDLLCRIDDQEFREHRASLKAEQAVLTHERDLAMAEDDPASVQLNQARKVFIETQLEMVDRRIRRTEIRATLDGFIVEGDLRDKVGSVLGKGLPLFEISPLNRMILEIHVPESEMDEFEKVNAGQFTIYARPDLRVPFEIIRIRPQAEIRDGKNVFVVEAKVDIPYEWMRPGMEGSARIVVDQRPVWWVAFHRGIDYVRYNWLP